MKELLNLLEEKNLLFKSLKPIDLKLFSSRKKIDLYLGVNLKTYYACIIHIKKKSKILSKEAVELMEFHYKLEQLNQSRITKKYIYIQAPICSKAKALLKKNKWLIWEN